MSDPVNPFASKPSQSKGKVSLSGRKPVSASTHASARSVNVYTMAAAAAGVAPKRQAQSMAMPRQAAWKPLRQRR